MPEITYHITALAGPTPLPPGTNDPGVLAYLVWAAGGIAILAGLCLVVRFVLRAARSASRAEDA